MQNIEISKISNLYEKLTFQIEQLKNQNLKKKGFFNYFQESDVENKKGREIELSNFSFDKSEMPLDFKDIKMRHENEEVPEENLVSNSYEIEKILKINQSIFHVNSECFNLEFRFTKEWMNNLVKDLIELKINVKFYHLHENLLPSQ